MSVSVDSLAASIMDELRAYSDEVSEALKESVKEASKECAAEIRKNAPKRSGEYRKGWKSEICYESRTDIRMEVYNLTKPTLSHLLEYGHAKRNGGRVEGKPHIRPAEEQLENKLERKIQVKMK